MSKAGILRRMFAGITAAALLLTAGCGQTTPQSSVAQSQSESAAQEVQAFKPGVYTAEATGRNGSIKIEAEFSETALERITVLEHSETEGIGNAAFDTLSSKIVGQQNLAVDVVSGATASSNAFLAAVEDCVRQAGGNVDTWKQAQAPAQNLETQELSADIVVVGAGAAGTAAALAAVETGAKVVLLEKTPSPMGAGTLAGGMFAADSQLQKDAGAVVDKEWLYRQYLDTSSGYMNSRLVRKIIDESGRTVDWLMANGCQLNLVDSGTGGAFEHVGMPKTLHGYVEGGTVAITKLVEVFRSKGGDVRFNTPATELMKDEQGKLTGVIAKNNDDGSTLKITAKAVILATGGFGGNEEMLKQYIGANYTVGQIAHNTGDGIQMAWGLGADAYGTDTAHFFAQTFNGDEIGKLAEVLGDAWFPITATLSSYPNLRVNKLGQRFSDETNVTLYAIHGAELHMQPQQTEYVILDSSMLDTIAKEGTAGIESHYSTWKDNRQFYMEFNAPTDTDVLLAAENTPTDYVPILDSLLDTGVVFKSDTIEGLANEMGVDEAAFVESVTQYNLAASSGRDELFFAEADRLLPVEKGPYYAIKFVARNLGTLGGVRINEDIEAVDVQGLPIPGLYVAGADAGGMYGKSYIDFEGGTLGFAYTSGRLAGLNAASFVKQ